jgi:hypothetical protein
MTTPSKVSTERSLFAHNDRNAILIASVMFMGQVAGSGDQGGGVFIWLATDLALLPAWVSV